MSQLAIDRQTLVGRDYIETLDWTVEEIDEALAVAGELKTAFRNGVPHRLLPDKTLFMLFLDKSTRTRNAFESGMTQLGGHAIYLDAEKTQVAHGESPKDMGIILSRYGHGLAIRHDLAPYEGNAWMREIAKWADIPLINLQCDVDHPTQTLADLMTLREQRGEDLRGLKVAVSWAYAPSYAKPLSVPQGLATLLPRFGIDVVLAHPKGFELMPEVLERAEAAAAESGATITYTNDMDEAFAGADVVYPKSWGRIDAFSDEKSALAESAEFKDWICDSRRMSLANARRPVHALPARRPGHRGHRRGHRRPAVRRLRRGREPDAHREGALCADHGWLHGRTGHAVKRKSAVVAIGGNSLIKDRFHQTVRDQYVAAGETCWHIASMIQDGWDVAIGHGNGPQVGFILRRSELAAGELHEVPLDVCGADSQGAIGYALTQNLENDFRRLGIDRHAVTVITQVEVARDDPAFASPSKPIGSFMDEATAIRRRDQDGWAVREDAGRGWRRVVASPEPIRIIEEDSIKTLIEDGFVVVSVGGGGIPVVADENGELSGVAAVIDKDLACSLLATRIGASLLLITTAVEHVALDFGTPDERRIDRMTLSEARQYLAEGVHFAEGSMAPKIRAVVGFLERGGEEAIITDPENVERALAGEAGTHVLPD